MTAMNMSGVDLNLFLVLHAVMEERSATRAAKRLHVTQSAVSNSLARLRDLFGDPLFVREGRGIVPTRRTEELAPLVATMVGQVALALESGRGFDNLHSTRTFTLCVADSHQACDVPPIAAAFARRMPSATLRVVSPDFLLASDGLATGQVDAAFFPQPAVPPGHRFHPLFEEQATLVVRRDHPIVKRAITREQFNTLPQIDVQVALGNPGTGNRVAVQHWKQSGLRRKVALVVPSFVTAAMTAARTDYLAGLPDRVASLFTGLLPLRVVTPAFPMPSIATVLVWHERTHADPGARAFRELIVDTIGAATSDLRRRPRSAARDS